MLRSCGSAFLALAVLSVPSLSRAAEEDDGARLKAGDRDPAFLERVNGCIEKAVAFVQGEQKEDGGWRCSHQGEGWDDGATALALLALLKSGVNRFDPCIEKGFRRLRGRPFRRTYTTSLVLMALEARWREEKPQDRIRGVSEPARRRRPRMPRPDLEWMREGVRFLVENREYCRRTLAGAGLGPRDAWSYPRKAKNNYADHSNTQFALLGLAAAARCGIPAPAEVHEKILRHFLSCQEKAGPRVQRFVMTEDRESGYVIYRAVSRRFDEARGWTYGASQQPRWGSGLHVSETTGSMTAVGVASVLLCLDRLGRSVGASLRARALRAVHDGLAWLDHRFSVTENPGHHEKGWFYYYLYGLERAAVLAGVRNIGRHDWYREGAEVLLGSQDPSGCWYERTYCEALPTACLALLFLTKATVPVQTKVTGR